MVLASPGPLLPPPPSSSPPKTPHRSYSAQTRSQDEEKNPSPKPYLPTLVSPPLTSGCSRVRATANLEIRNIRVAGQNDLLVDVTVRHNFKGTGHNGQTQGQLRNPDNPESRTTSSRAPLPTRSAIIATHIAATGMWLFCRRACLPRDASTASSDA